MSTLLKTSTGLSVRIHDLPGRPPFMTSSDLAEAYGVTARKLNQAIRRNPDRFPEDFAFVLSEDEMAALKSHSVTSNTPKAALSRRANRALPVAFTHAGALMISAVLRTPQAVAVSIEVHRAFAAMEAAAAEAMAQMFARLNIETVTKKPIRIWVQHAADRGWTFDALWRQTSYSRAKLAAAVHECVAIGLIAAPLPGTPALTTLPAAQPGPDPQADLFHG
jgi:hypothetical protein